MDRGYIDPSLSPFNADPSGTRDATQALQRAVDLAKEFGFIVYLPSGNYRITDTLKLSQPFAHTFTANHRFFAGVIRGSSRPSGPSTIFVPDNTPGFQDPSNPKVAILLHTTNIAQRWEPNVNMNQALLSLHVRIGRGNYGAVGVEARGAQGTGLENVTIFAGDGLSGLFGAAGSGGSHHGVTVVGGRVGLDYRQAQPAPSSAAIRLVNQSCAGIVYSGLQTLTLVGINISSHSAFATAGYRPIYAGTPLPSAMFNDTDSPCYLPALKDWQRGGPAYSGQITITDAILQAPENIQAEAISTSSNIVLQNVYFKGFATAAQLVQIGASFPLPCNASQWCQVKTLIKAQPSAPDFVEGHAYVFPHPAYVNGERYSDFVRFDADPALSLPEYLVTQHLWSASVPDFLDQGHFLNVRDDPYNAVGDGQSDDWTSLQQAIDDASLSGQNVYFPPGIYAVGKPLRSPDGVALVGTAHHLVHLVPLSTLPSSAAFAILTIGSASQTTAPERPAGVYGINIETWSNTPNVTPLLWQGQHPEGYVRQFGHWIKDSPCMDFGVQCALQSPSPLPQIVFNGSLTNVKAYTLHKEDFGPTRMPDHRHVLISNTHRGRLNFYHLNTEHAGSDANFEVRDSSATVNIYGVKSEGQYCVGWVNRASNVTIYGYGGNACPFPYNTSYPQGYHNATPSVFRFTQATNSRIYNLIDFATGSTLPLTALAAVECTPIDQRVLAVVEGSISVQTQQLDRPVLLEVGACD
eukprot:TRINITY_DN9551_c0_g1_i1.p1 TRINITY_DN9551_c0_g1~~TRINITY_DN9551_c0_g1_i1.p1  ORF type:complete len:795 (+),score=134.21 TRINITY_DN9551_c0_g1_i1:141-2387(+)